MIIQETPTLNLQFDKARNDSDMLSLLKSQGGTFTRGSEVVGSGDSVASYNDALGTVRLAKLGHPRPNFVDGVNQGLLIEEARTNLLQRSEEFDNAVWVKTNTTFTGNTLTANAGTSFKGISQNQATQGEQVIYFDVEYVDHAFFQILVGTSGGDTGFSNFNIQTKVLGSTAGAIVSRKIEDFGSYVRISLTLNTVNKTSAILAFVDTSSSGRAASSVSTGSVIVHRAQNEAGSFPTSYIPTAGTTVTRGAEKSVILNATDIINPNEGTIILNANFKKNLATTGFFISLVDGIILTEAIYVTIETNNSIAFYIRSGGATKVIEVTNVNWTEGISTFVFRYSGGVMKIFWKGVEKASNTYVNSPIPNRIVLGVRPDTQTTLSPNTEYIKTIYYPKAIEISDALLLSRI